MDMTCRKRLRQWITAERGETTNDAKAAQHVHDVPVAASNVDNRAMGREDVVVLDAAGAARGHVLVRLCGLPRRRRK